MPEPAQHRVDAPVVGRREKRAVAKREQVAAEPPAFLIAHRHQLDAARRHCREERVVEHLDAGERAIGADHAELRV